MRWITFLHPAPTTPGTIGARAGPARARSRATVALVILAALVLLGLGVLHVVQNALHEAWHSVPPPVPHINVYEVLADLTPVTVTTSAEWTKVPYRTTVEALRSDPTLWRRVRIEDWDTVQPSLRVAALDAMLQRYRELLITPSVWDRMTPEDWDDIPQPMRVLAFRHMAQYWSGYYDLGRSYGISPGDMTETLVAIMMTESWFEHRAVNTNRWENRDLGVAQASDAARERMRDWYWTGDVEFLLEDSHYFNPWHGSRFVAVWMRRLLEQSSGDLETAIRGYHRGIDRALQGDGAEYYETVKRRQRLLRSAGNQTTLGYLLARDRDIARAAWPWLRFGPGPRAATEGPWLPRLPARPALHLTELARLAGH